jgi:hypothetical protein
MLAPGEGLQYLRGEWAIQKKQDENEHVQWAECLKKKCVGDPFTFESYIFFIFICFEQSKKYMSANLSFTILLWIS